MDLHAKPFDAGTQVKLRLFRDYLEEWFPTFVHNKSSRTINIFDFFAGPGRDSDGVPGSPLLALKVIESYAEAVRKKGVAVNLYLNDDDSEKVTLLKDVIAQRMSGSSLPDIVNVEISCQEFKELFEKRQQLMKPFEAANFLFLDQSGISEITKPIFEDITTLSTTDFMFFVASESIHRFGGVGATAKHIDIPPEEIRRRNHNHIHRTVTDYYRSLIPPDRKYYLAPFSIKKTEAKNIYGLVFGTAHLLGLDKFMHVAWKIDKNFGEANYDVDGEKAEEGQMFMFDNMRKPTKMELFKKALTEALESREVSTNLQVLEFTLTHGFLSSHAKEILKELMKEGIIPEQSLAVSYDSCKKEEKPIEFA